jgi:uncharacterized protein YdeI (YjbR/CyaY-like superfamily)
VPAPRRSHLKRPLVPMSSDVRAALDEAGLSEAYAARPPYQRNDYLGWIERAVRPETRAKRLDTMLRELAAGHGYMGMDWRPR